MPIPSHTECVAKILFLSGLILAASGLLSPPVALALGLAFGFSFDHPFHAKARHALVCCFNYRSSAWDSA